MNGATLQLGANQTIGGLSCSMSMSGGSGGSYVNLNSYTLTTSGLYYGGTVYGSGSFNVGGTSTQFWGGDSASTTTVTGGTLLLNEGGSLNGSVTIDSEATLQVGDGYSNGVVGSITDNGTLLFRPNSSGESYSGVISGIGSLMVVGSGSSGGYPTLTLAGANTFTGLTQISGGGTLALGSSLALQDSALDTTNFPSSSLSIGTLTAVTLGGLQGPSGTTLNLSGGAVTLTVGNNGTNTRFPAPSAAAAA